MKTDAKHANQKTPKDRRGKTMNSAERLPARSEVNENASGHQHCKMA